MQKRRGGFKFSLLKIGQFEDHSGFKSSQNLVKKSFIVQQRIDSKMDKINMSLDDVIKVGRKDAKAKKTAAAKKVPGKAAPKMKVGSAGAAKKAKDKKTKGAKGGASMDVSSKASNNAAKSTGKAKAARNATVAAKRGITPASTIATKAQLNAHIKQEAKKLAEKMIAASQKKAPKGAKGGNNANNRLGGYKLGGKVRISFNAADLARTTAPNVSKQIRGVLNKAPNGKKGGAGARNGGNNNKPAQRKVILK